MVHQLKNGYFGDFMDLPACGSESGGDTLWGGITSHTQLFPFFPQSQAGSPMINNDQNEWIFPPNKHLIGLKPKYKKRKKLQMLISWVLWDGFWFWKQFFNQQIMLIHLGIKKTMLLFQIKKKLYFFGGVPPTASQKLQVRGP